ncbi:MAG: site-specific DNA-methyltransferase [Armatimonadota bacterium]
MIDATPLYVTARGAAYHGDALDLLARVPDDSIDLVLTSPPFALLRQKDYGNEAQAEYVQWLMPFCVEVMRVLRDSGSFVLDLGGAYQRGRPVRALYQYRVLIALCDEIGFRLAQDFFWYNPAKLPAPIEWVNKRKIRVKDAVNTVWWLSKSDWPKANARRVLKPYSGRMEQLLRERECFYTPAERPSGHDVSARFMEDRGGAIPPNLLEIPNTSSNSQYLRLCREVGVRGHPARFPKELPRFFIAFLTDPADTVLDIFAGSNTTGLAAEEMGRAWLAFEADREYLAASAFRFLDESTVREAPAVFARLVSGEAEGLEVPQQARLLR